MRVQSANRHNYGMLMSQGGKAISSRQCQRRHIVWLFGSARTKSTPWSGKIL